MINKKYYIYKANILLSQIIPYPLIYLKLLLVRFTNYFIVKKFHRDDVLTAYNHKEQLGSVSVVFPTRNGYTNGVVNLINSLRDQTVRPIQIIAVDSGSTDGTQSYLYDLGVDVIDNSMNSFHHGKSRNIGAMKASGDFILFTVDDAVFFDNTWIERSLKLLVKSGSDSISGTQKTPHLGNYYSVFKTLSQLHSANSKFFDYSIIYIPIIIRKIYKILKVSNPIAPIDDTNHLTRKSTFDRLKFRTDTVEDLEYGTRLLEQGGSVFFSNYLTISHGHIYLQGDEEKYSKRIAIDQKIFRNVFHYGPFNKYSVCALYHAFAEIFSVCNQFSRACKVTKFESNHGLFDHLLAQRNIHNRTKFLVNESVADKTISKILGESFLMHGKTPMNFIDKLNCQMVVDRFYINLAHAYVGSSECGSIEILYAKSKKNNGYVITPNIKEFINLYRYIAINMMVTLVSFSPSLYQTKLDKLSISDWN